jgi:isoquinoline 1-oxidoreductase beta subunit
VIRAQIESGVGYSLGPALRNKITLTNGLIDQANFDTYEPLRLSDMPAVEVHIVKSNEPPTGIGEPGVPPIAPAISNAIFAATGKRLRSLPFDFELLNGSAGP